jgi:hypothetical protein
MKFLLRIVLSICSAGLVCCATQQNSLYQSSAPGIRGERAIASDIELVSEVDLGGYILGVFYSREVYEKGDAQNILLTYRNNNEISSSTKKLGSIVDYNLAETSSLSIEQAGKLLSAIDKFIATNQKDLTPAKMFSFELYSGTLDMSAGSDRYHPFREVTFAVICSVTSAQKSFKMIIGKTELATLDLTEEQVKGLRNAISTTLNKATPEVAPAESDTPVARLPGPHSSQPFWCAIV